MMVSVSPGFKGRSTSWTFLLLLFGFCCSGTSSLSTLWTWPNVSPIASALADSSSGIFLTSTILIAPWIVLTVTLKSIYWSLSISSIFMSRMLNPNHNRTRPMMNVQSIPILSQSFSILHCICVGGLLIFPLLGHTECFKDVGAVASISQIVFHDVSLVVEWF